MTPQTISGLPTWLHMLAQVYPPHSVALVGAGNGTSPLVQWLQSHASQAGQGAPAVTLLEPHAPSMAQLAKRLAGTQACAEWRLLPELLAPEQDGHTYHQYTLAAENGLLPPEALHPLWPSLQLQSQEQVATVPLAQLLPAGWLLLDCLPAAHLLQGTRLPDSTQVVLARVVLSDAAPAGSSLASVQALLAQSGFKAVATFAERNSALGKALFVRDPKGLQDNIDQALAKAKALEADKAQLTEAKDKALAQVQQLAQEKAQALQRCDELAKAKEAETAAKQAEAQARAAEQQAKEQALAKAQALEAEKAKLTEAKDKALAQVQQLAQEKAQAQQRCDELAKAKETEAQARAAEQQAKEQALAKVRTLEADKAQLTEVKDKALAQVQQLVREKAQALQRCDELAKAKETESQARAAEQQGKEQALAKAQALEVDKAQLTDAKDKAFAQVRQIEQEKVQAQQRCDELAKAKAELQSQLEQVNQALHTEKEAKQAEAVTLNKDLQSIKTKLLQNETLFQASLSMGSEAPTQLRFNSKSEGIYKNKQGLVKFDLPGNTPTYLVSNEAGDFQIAPKLNSVPLEANKAYELTGTVIYEGSIAPVVWLFEYDENKQKINSRSYPTQSGELRTIFKTQAKAASYAIGIRLGGSGSLNPHNTWFKFENSLAIEVAEAKQHNSADFDKKLTDLQAKLQKDQQSQSKNNLRQIESFLRLQNYCGDRMVLPDMHGWPVSPDLGVYIIRLVEAGGFDAIVEFGSGVSTLLIALALQKTADPNANGGSTQFVSFEHLESYLQQTQAQLHQAQLSPYVQLVSAPLVESAGAQNNPSLYYDCQATLQQLRQSIDKPNPKLLVFVDGPPASTGPLARFPAMPAIEQAFEGSAEVHYLMDDYIRQDERNIVDQWQTHLDQQGRQVEKQELKQFEKQACLLITKAQL